MKNCSSVPISSITFKMENIPYLRTYKHLHLIEYFTNSQSSPNSLQDMYANSRRTHGKIKLKRALCMLRYPARFKIHRGTSISAALFTIFSPPSRPAAPGERAEFSNRTRRCPVPICNGIAAPFCLDPEREKKKKREAAKKAKLNKSKRCDSPSACSHSLRENLAAPPPT